MESLLLLVTRERHDRLLRDVRVGSHRLSRSAAEGATSEGHVRGLESSVQLVRLLERGAEEELFSLARVEEGFQVLAPLRGTVARDVVHSLASFHTLALLDEGRDSPVLVDGDVVLARAEVEDVSLASSQEPEQHQSCSYFAGGVRRYRLGNVVRCCCREVDGLVLLGKEIPSLQSLRPHRDELEANGSIPIERIFSNLAQRTVHRRQAAEVRRRTPTPLRFRGQAIDMVVSNLCDREIVETRILTNAFLKGEKHLEVTHRGFRRHGMEGSRRFGIRSLTIPEHQLEKVMALERHRLGQDGGREKYHVQRGQDRHGRC